MPFKKGQPRAPSAGRKKGTPNKETLNAQARAELLGIDPFEIMLFFAAGDWQRLGYKSETETKFSAKGDPYEVQIITPQHRLMASMEAVQYLLPKRKALEPMSIEAKVDGKADIVIKWIDDDVSRDAPADTATKEV